METTVAMNALTAKVKGLQAAEPGLTFVAALDRVKDTDPQTYNSAMLERFGPSPRTARTAGAVSPERVLFLTVQKVSEERGLTFDAALTTVRAEQPDLFLRGMSARAARYARRTR